MRVTQKSSKTQSDLEKKRRIARLSARIHGYGVEDRPYKSAVITSLAAARTICAHRVRDSRPAARRGERLTYMEMGEGMYVNVAYQIAVVLLPIRLPNVFGS